MSLNYLSKILLLCLCAFALNGQTNSNTSELQKSNFVGYDNVAVGDFSKDGDLSDGKFNNDNRIAVNLAEGEHDANNDFIQEKISKISGSVMEDTNNDNIGDKPLPGVVIRLFEKSGVPAKDINGKAVPFQITNSLGYYEFENLKAGEYFIIKSEISNEQELTQTPLDNSVAEKPLPKTSDLVSASKQQVNERSPVKETALNEIQVEQNNPEESKKENDLARPSGYSFQDVVDNKVPKSESSDEADHMDIVKTQTENIKKPTPVFEMPAQKHVLLIGSSIDEASQAFLPFKMNFGNYLYENYDYVSHPKLGTGYDVNIKLPDLLNFEMVFLKMDMGSFSETMLEALAEYIEIGGKIYIIFDAYDRAYYLTKMEENVNALLKRINVDDMVKFSHEIVNNQNKSGVVSTVSNQVRYKSAKKNKEAQASNENEKRFLTTMGKGHYIKSISDLSEANTICRFEVDNEKYITNVFWQTGHGGALGIGTEKQTSAYPEYGSIDAWKILAEGLNLNH